MTDYWATPKDPNEVLDYLVDWSASLDDDIIVSSTWTLPVGISATLEAHGNATTEIWLNGGTEGQTYKLLNRITTAGGRTRDQTCAVKIKTK